MTNFNQTFNFRRTAVSQEALELIEAQGYADKVQFFAEDGTELPSVEGAAHVQKLPQVVELQVPTVMELVEGVANGDAKASKILELLLEKGITEIVRKDFDGGKNPLAGWIGGVVPEGYKFDTEYLLAQLMPATRASGSGASTVKVKELRALAELFNAWLIASGKSAKSANLQSGLLVEKYAGKVMAVIKPEMFPALTANLLDFAASLTEEELEVHTPAIEFSVAAIENAQLATVEVTLDDI